MEDLFIDPSPFTPLVRAQAAQGEISLSGRAMPEDGDQFFRPLFEWIDGYLETPAPTTQIEIRLDYFNSSSSKYLLLLLRKFEALAQQGQTVSAKWYYDPEDEDTLEFIEQLDGLLSLVIEAIEDDPY